MTNSAVASSSMARAEIPLNAALTAETMTAMPTATEFPIAATVSSERRISDRTRPYFARRPILRL